MDYLKTIKKLRETNKEFTPRGIFVFHMNQYQGWMNELKDACKWPPGCIAVDESGNQWKASGGNARDGAKEWLPRNWGGIREPSEGKALGRPKKAPDQQLSTKSFRLDPTTIKTLTSLTARLKVNQTEVIRMAVHNLGVEYELVEDARKDGNMHTELQKRVYRIKTTALMRAREHMSSVELIHWWEKFVQKTRKARNFEELDEEMQAQILKWESEPYKVIGT
ncbi:MAG: hypothetical protein MI802_15775 [Desulfobacterales bacterium]|nr:hypothetical protein [Desulfobacterales bacterium]